MDERAFQKRLTTAIARINDLPAARRVELLALSARVSARPAATAAVDSRRPRRSFVRE
jgi:hypothetical protein